MKQIKSFGLLLACLSLTACPLMTREDVQKQEEEKALREQVVSIQKSKADTEVKLSDVANDLRVVAGRVDSLDHNQENMNRSLRQENDVLRKQIEAQNEKIRLVEQHLDQTEQRLLAAIQGSAPAPSNNNTGDAAVESKTHSKKSADPFEEAEELFNKKEFKKAIVKYQSYRDKSSKGAKVAEATYKIGVCFSELGMKKDAKEFYSEVIESYPNSKPAKKAKFRLDRLK